MLGIHDEILAVNEAFYAAFAAGDYPALWATWSRSDAVSVIHPGSSALHGQHAVMNSWRQILENSGGSEIQCENASVYMHGDSAYVICHEILPGGKLIATNIFVHEKQGWRMVHHQAGPENREVHQGTEFSNAVH